MNREEFQTERTRIISEMLDNPDEYGIYPTTKCFEQLDALFDSLSLPPAEGAEANRASIDDLIKKHIPIDAANFEYCAKHNIINGGLLQGIRDVVNSFMKPQPTAEGAEEMDARTYLDEWMRQHNYRSNKLIGWSEAVDFADDFATLHAQRIAEKMVSERSEFIKKAVIRFFYTEVDLNFCTREYRDRVEWYFNTYQHEIFKLPKTSLDNFKSREK